MTRTCFHARRAVSVRPVLALILLVLSVGLADAINPATLAPAFLLATAPDGAKAVGRFTLGVFAVSLAGGLVLLLGPGQLILSALPHPSAHTKAVAEAVGGVLLLGLATLTWIHRDRIASRLAREDDDSDDSDRGAFALGAGLMAIELPTALPYFAAIAAILASPFGLGTQIALVVLYNIAFVAPLLVLLIARELAGEKAAARLERLGAWLRLRAPAAIAVLLALLGVIVGAVGISHLV
jgi:cytochrome c biogenesis protein CcdA